MTVCPTGASYKRAEDGIVLVNEDLCIGCKLCSWACPYGAREFDEDAGVMKKCTLCIDRIYNDHLRAGGPRAGLRRHLPGLGAALRRSRRSQLCRLQAGCRPRGLRPDAGDGLCPTNKYLPPRPRKLGGCSSAPAELAPAVPGQAGGLLGWLDRLLSQQ